MLYACMLYVRMFGHMCVGMYVYTLYACSYTVRTYISDMCTNRIADLDATRKGFDHIVGGN